MMIFGAWQKHTPDTRTTYIYADTHSRIANSMCQCVCAGVFVCVHVCGNSSSMRSVSRGTAVSKRYILSWLRVKHAKCVCIRILTLGDVGNQDSMANTQC